MGDEPTAQFFLHIGYRAGESMRGLLLLVLIPSHFKKVGKLEDVSAIVQEKFASGIRRNGFHGQFEVIGLHTGSGELLRVQFGPVHRQCALVDEVDAIVLLRVERCGQTHFQNTIISANPVDLPLLPDIPQQCDTCDDVCGNHFPTHGTPPIDKKMPPIAAAANIK